jgi:hypothetical protein
VRCGQLFKVVTDLLRRKPNKENKPIKTITYNDYWAVTANSITNCRLAEHSFSMASSRITSDQSK